jgi:predicted nucleotidyltransferase
MQLDSSQRERLAQVAQQHRLELVIAFGSSVTGKTHAQSDLDLAVRLHSRSDLETAEYSELVHALQQIFPGRAIDLTLINHADPLLLHEIAERGALLYGEMAAFQELRIYAFKRFQDHRRFLKMERRYVEQFLAARQK